MACAASMPQPWRCGAGKKMSIFESHELTSFEFRVRNLSAGGKCTAGTAAVLHDQRHDGCWRTVVGSYEFPMMQMPAASATSTMRSKSNSSVRPASTHKQVAPAARIVSIVATPTTGTSKRMF